MSIQTSELRPIITIRLREAMQAFAERAGGRMTYEILAERTGLARTTIESIATRPGYNATLSTVAQLCAALDCGVGDLLEFQRRPRPRKGAK